MTEVLQCNSVGTYDQYFFWGKANKVLAVNAPDDDNGSGIGAYIVTSGRQSFLLAASSLPSGTTINSVTIRSRITQSPNLSTYQPFLRLGGVEVYGPSQTPSNVWETRLDTISRPGGSSWTVADLATLEIGYWCDSGDYLWVCTAEAVIDYSAPGPGGTGDMLLVF